MASAMKNLMDLFYDEQKIAKANEDFDLSETLEQAVSYTNNCHGMTPAQMIEHVRGCLNGLYEVDDCFYSDESIDTAMTIIDLFVEQYSVD